MSDAGAIVFSSPTRILKRTGPSLRGELDAAGLQAAPVSITPDAVEVAAFADAATLQAVEAVVAAHDPTKPGPPVQGPNSSCSKLGLKRAFEEKGLWQTVRFMISSDPALSEDWDLAIELRISDPLIKTAVAALAQQGIALSDADVQALVTRANELVA